ncbi:MAG TPA: M20/M25/M40 family metallo-hydrolase [Terriglobales bacterium]|nr:M20/M25/M40 family metallo-hydrolase [Terriglobales bacterium]
MRQILSVVLFLCFASFAFGQYTTPRTPGTGSPEDAAYSPQLRSDLAALRDAALNDDYAYRQLAHLTENIGPRPSGSPQAEAAVNYVAGELRKLGLEVKLEEVKCPHWVRGEETAQLVEYPGQVPNTTQKIVLTALAGNTPTTANGLTAEVVVVNNFDELQALGKEKVAGKVVLYNAIFDKRKSQANHAFNAYEEAVVYRYEGAERAAALGAVASLVRSMGDADFRLPHTGTSKAAGIPQAAVTAEDAMLIAHLAAQGKVRIHLLLTSQRGPDVISHNVVADLKGSEHPEQIVLVSGHLDSWDLGTGAIDDAGGVAAAMQVVQLVQKLHLKPRRTLRVVAWMNEEDGASGRDAYAAAHQAEFPNHVAVFESDSGPFHPSGIEAKISVAGSKWLLPAQDVLAPIGANLIDLVDDSPETDIEPMAKFGIPAFALMVDGRPYFHYHHTPADTLDKVPARDLQENAAVFSVMAYAIANLPQPLPH